MLFIITYLLGEVSLASVTVDEDLEKQSINPALSFSCDDGDTSQQVHFCESEDLADLGSISRESKQSGEPFIVAEPDEC